MFTTDHRPDTVGEVGIRGWTVALHQIFRLEISDVAPPAAADPAGS
jgi:hypothetical protein